MLKAPLTLSKARVLITNDDGVDAPGIALLHELVRPLVAEAIICAPEYEQSGSSHVATISRPLRLRRAAEDIFAVDGTPADSLIMGVREVMKDRQPDIVLSGINNGANLGEDVNYSGTLAACFEATLMRIPAIGFSQDKAYGQPANFQVARHWLVEVLERLVSQPWPQDVLMSVNFPNIGSDSVRGIAPTRLGRKAEGVKLVPGVDPRGHTYYWNAWRYDNPMTVDCGPDTDIGALGEGHVSVTPLTVDPTHAEGMSMLKRILGKAQAA
mgnify:CR=1 FL=1